jgi:hypothetical protein
LLEQLVRAVRYNPNHSSPQIEQACIDPDVRIEVAAAIKEINLVNVSAHRGNKMLIANSNIGKDQRTFNGAPALQML